MLNTALMIVIVIIIIFFKNSNVSDNDVGDDDDNFWNCYNGSEMKVFARTYSVVIRLLFLAQGSLKFVFLFF